MSISISRVVGRQIYDSRGNPTVEADVILSDGTKGRAAVPSGASTGTHESVEKRDDTDRWGGKGVLQAVDAINKEINPCLRGADPQAQKGIDLKLINLDGTINKSRLGANAILAVSLAVAKAAAKHNGVTLHDYIARLSNMEQSLPMPMINIMNGGAHANNSSDIQEYMIIPHSARTIDQALEMASNTFHTLGKLLKKQRYSTSVGDEGGYAPSIKNGNSEPLNLIMQAITEAGYTPGEDISIALDIAASELYKDSIYSLKTENKLLSSPEMIKWIKNLFKNYPIVSIEDGLDEDDWQSWQKLTKEIGRNHQIVGDDIFVTHSHLLTRGVIESSANAVLIKPNQVGTLSETIDAVRIAKAAGWNTIMSHRSGETEDTTIAHLAVGLGCGQIKTGSMSRSERMAKYNELLRIAERQPHLTLASPFNGVLHG